MAAEATAEFKPPIAFDDFAKLDLRVATIREAAEHPNADKLLVLQLDDGSESGRQICAGIRGHYEPSELVGRQIVIVANLEPRKIRGEVSQGMLLAGSDVPKDPSSEQPRRVILLRPDDELPAGSSVS